MSTVNFHLEKAPVFVLFSVVYSAVCSLHHFLIPKGRLLYQHHMKTHVLNKHLLEAQIMFSYLFEMISLMPGNDGSKHHQLQFLMTGCVQKMMMTLQRQVYQLHCRCKCKWADASGESLLHEQWSWCDTQRGVVGVNTQSPGPGLTTSICIALTVQYTTFGLTTPQKTTWVKVNVKITILIFIYLNLNLQ